MKKLWHRFWAHYHWRQANYAVPVKTFGDVRWGLHHINRHEYHSKRLTQP